MHREVPPWLAVILIIIVVAIAGYVYHRSSRTPEGAGVTKEELRQEFLRRAQSGQLPAGPEQLKRLQQSGSK